MSFKIEVKFYADTFRKVQLELPDDAKDLTPYDRRNYVLSALAHCLEEKGIRPPTENPWQLPRLHRTKESITIITAKYI